MFKRSIFGLALISAFACQASVGARVDAKGAAQSDAESRVDADANVRLEQSHKAASADWTGPTEDDDAKPSTNGATSASEAMLGARAGLHLAKPSVANCQCLGVVVGNPTDSNFLWEGPVPNTDVNTQLVIGLSAEGLPCPTAAADSLGASYRGYEMVGPDVVVQVETARFGRPVAQGAVIPKPHAGGQVLVRASDAESPYGRSADGKALSCRVWPAP